MPLGLLINAMFIDKTRRVRNGKTDGYDVLVAAGTDVFKVKMDAVSEDWKLGDNILIQSRVTCFNDRIYFSGEALNAGD